MDYSFVIGGRHVTVSVKQSEALSMGPVYAFTVNATARNGEVITQEIYTPRYEGSIEGQAKRRARYVVRYAVAHHERNLAFSHHDDLITRRTWQSAYFWPEEYKRRIHEVVKMGCMKGTPRMIEQATEEWLR